jgi:hypothetical protein
MVVDSMRVSPMPQKRFKSGLIACRRGDVR